MSVPLVLSVLDATAPNVPVIDEHTEHCNAVVNNVIQRAGEPSVVTSPTGECIPSPRTFTIQLPKPLESNEFMGLTGDSFELGSWDPLRSVQLTQVTPTIWNGTVNLSSPGQVQYRYFVYSLDSLGRIQIKRWEAYVEPRNMRTCNGNCMRMDQFGEIDGQKKIARGWLTNETIVQLKFLNQVFEFDGGFTPERMYLKLVNLENEQDLPNYNESLNNAEVVNMKYNRSVFERQSDLGTLYKAGDIVLFQMSIPLGQENGKYALVLHSEDRQPLGHAPILLSTFQENDGKLELNVTSHESGEIIASAKISYLIVRPLPGIRMNFRTSYAYTWKPKWDKLLVGHRGDGISFAVDGAPITENTIASYKLAYDVNVDMIEIDVHITEDLVPVIYHDYKIFTAPNGTRPKSKDDLIQVYIKDIRYSQLKDLRIFRVLGDEIREYPSHNEEERKEHRLFPTLEDLFHELPLGLAINIEIKWPQARFDGVLEAEQVTDKNLFVDMVLLTTLRHGCGRMLIFSSFDADICAMVRLKQNMLPAMFLTQGSTKKWPAYEDPRCNSFEAAVNNAQLFELTGIAPYSEDVLKDHQMVRLATDLGQKVFLWGYDINSLERVQFFEAAGVTANIFDRADLIVPKERTAGVFNNPETIEYFRGQCPL
ncbi:glycerophosphocholine phosphodiesterase GPCPD1-like isoform X2 [Episyrphus balteatus]|uniref:glycerophosphocholine phosphodiesterase GPCPD1-like isoform X2 n=1 Tax=Episyrphus balteatus TaxID=286459 RepID=UPI002484F4C9|nr:glycerophosphocholine phosphodiesterase GPCPD1-like isoform X2 [Episyrphus balteatus]